MNKWNVKAAREALKRKMRSIPRDEGYVLLEVEQLVSTAEEDGEKEVWLTDEEDRLLR